MATASVYFQRFYIHNSYAATDPILVLVTCVYVASKVEESPVRIRTFCAEAAKMMSEWGYKDLPNSVSMIAEMEFFLLEELEFDLVVFHPYSSLPHLCQTCLAHRPPQRGGRPAPHVYAEDGDHAKSDSLLQVCWLIVNDMYRTSLPLEQPPYMLAIASLYLAVILHPTTAEHIYDATYTNEQSMATDDVVSFLAGLNVSLPMVTRIVQQMMAHYTLWHELSLPATNTRIAFTDHAAMFQRLYRMRNDRYKALLLIDGGAHTLSTLAAPSYDLPDTPQRLAA